MSNFPRHADSGTDSSLLSSVDSRHDAGFDAGLDSRPPSSPASRPISSASASATSPLPTLETVLASLVARQPGSFATLGSTYLTHQPAQALPAPYLVCVSPDAMSRLGFAPEAASQPAFTTFFSGETRMHEGGQVGAQADKQSGEPVQATALPFASVYSGHQFGNWAGQLGDGRALSVGELKGTDGERYELQFKGSGMTPYSRMGDGRAVLRSSIREFLCSEAMDALGIPTTRALSVVGSDLRVRRETMETTAIVTRFAPSFIRFGHFEHFWSTGQHDALRVLADHVIEHFFPDIQATRATSNPYLALLTAVSISTADMIAHWQSVGFCHGVMNTDNMSILGLTIDYGPFGFLDGFDAKHICNHTDTQGRYAFQNQPQVAYWNLFCLAQALLPLIAAPNPDDAQPADGSDAATLAVEQTKAAVEPFKVRYAAQFGVKMRQKLGLQHEETDDATLIDRLLQLMHDNRADFTLTFRRLATISAETSEGVPHVATDSPAAIQAAARDLFVDRASFDVWADTYRTRLGRDGRSDAERRTAMNRVNPKFILRNHLAELAIRAANQRDFSVTETLLNALRHPFDEQQAHDDYAGLPPDWAGGLEVSCSS